LAYPDSARIITATTSTLTDAEYDSRFSYSVTECWVTHLPCQISDPGSYAPPHTHQVSVGVMMYWPWPPIKELKTGSSCQRGTHNQAILPCGPTTAPRSPSAISACSLSTTGRISSEKALGCGSDVRDCPVVSCTTGLLPLPDGPTEGNI